MKQQEQSGTSKYLAGHHSRKKLDLSGEQFGRLTVLRPAENINNRTAWLCRCECGNEVIVKTVCLREGKVKSCGCLPPITLVDGTCIEILKSKTIRKNNRSGVSGVDWMKSRQKWRASICFKGKRYFLGRYNLFEEAVVARKIAEVQLHDTFVEQFNNAQNK